jgi:hypothetical protein
LPRNYPSGLDSSRAEGENLTHHVHRQGFDCTIQGLH